MVPLSVALRITRLSQSRYHGWRRAECGMSFWDAWNSCRVVGNPIAVSSS